MKISTKGRYAIRMMADLAMQDAESYIPLRDVAARQNISIKYLEQITALLNKAGMLISTRGNNGGYRLSRAPHEYTIGDILRVTEGNLTPVSCVVTGQCESKGDTPCLTRRFWHGLYACINDYVDHFTLADLIADSKSPVTTGRKED